MAKGTHRITLVGAGNLAQALLELLPKSGFAVDEVVTRSGSRRPRLTARLRRSGARLRSFGQANFDADVVWLAVADSAIPKCARQLAEIRDWKHKVVLHSSGALSSDELDVLRCHGASVAAAHPMMSFVGDVPDLRDVAWTVEGDPKAKRVASEIIRGLGGAAFKINKRDKPLYHAFGAFLSPLLVVHLEAAGELARRTGLSRRATARFIGPIVRRTVDNLLRHSGKKDGAGKAFSGPLMRGDIGTIEQHLKALRGLKAPQQLYTALVRAAVESRLPVKNRNNIRRLLRSRS